MAFPMNISFDLDDLLINGVKRFEVEKNRASAAHADFRTLTPRYYWIV